MAASGKVAIVGVGPVGVSVANNLLHTGLCQELCLVDLNADRAYGEARDLMDYAMFLPFDVSIRAGGYSDCKDMDVVVIAASGRPSDAEQGEGRNRFVQVNGKIVRSVVEEVMASGFRGIFVLISNPVDVMTYVAWKVSGLPRSQVIGTGCLLDTQRLRWAVRDLTGVDKEHIDIMALGEHGEAMTIPWELSRIGAACGETLLSDEQKAALKERSITIGGEIFQRKNTTQFGIAATTVEIVSAVLTNRHCLLPVSAVLDGEYGYKDVCCSIPCVLDRSGVHIIHELPLSSRSKAGLDECVATIKSHIKRLPF